MWASKKTLRGADPAPLAAQTRQYRDLQGVRATMLQSRAQRPRPPGEPNCLVARVQGT